MCNENLHRQLQHTYINAIFNITGAWLRWIFGLPFLNPENVEECFLQFMAILPSCTKIQSFADYLVENYIEEDAKFHPTVWAACTSSTEMTTNGCESFHSKFNSLFYAPHPNLYVFLDVLKNIQIDTYIKLNSAHVPKHITNKNYKTRLANLADNIELYNKNKITMLNFVQRASFHIKTK